MKLRLLGKESTPTNSPTLYATDQNSYVIQGWVVTDVAVLARCSVLHDETLVEVPCTLLDYLAMDGLDGQVSNIMTPIVDVTPNRNYILRGKSVIDTDVLNQMSIPDHETCILVTKSAVITLLTER